MKTLLILLLVTTSRLIHGQIVHQTINEDKTYEYWFSLDQYQKPLNYAIEIAHLGGNVNKLVGKMKDNSKNGNMTIHDTKGKLLFEKKLGSDLSFEFATDQKEVVIAFTVDGFATYTKKTSVETLSVLVMKLQPESQDEVYQINSKKELAEAELDSIMKCVHNCMQHTVNKDINTCAKNGEYSISLQL
ncbi:hypothetical protein [Fluviicola taffensis]|uniref:Uncharacterized protein n=1 Tax=Fluviicola taffensis (strain DSM 16823 / NCIMB 13979 / RW262) TaxID=755732 RepID=F2IKJ7_FLUTR|nr:hypothetical protein [Fluviicola taffensis]AEA45123.1 hypothetical protein Fluta_3149 [Fluviicola taffensis DSM 16823]